MCDKSWCVGRDVALERLFNPHDLFCVRSHHPILPIANTTVNAVRHTAETIAKTTHIAAHPLLWRGVIGDLRKREYEGA